MSIIRNQSLENHSPVKTLVPPGAYEKFIPVDSGFVRILRSKNETSQPPVVLIHGGGTDHAGISWYKLFEPLSRNHNVLALDLPGFGATENIEPVGGPDQMADFAVKVMGILSIKEAHFCGVSM